jgi:hypothetical protein
MNTCISIALSMQQIQLLVISSVVDLNPNESECFGWILIRILKKKFGFGYVFKSRHRYCYKIKIIPKNQRLTVNT